jgi:hypothetical protein
MAVCDVIRGFVPKNALKRVAKYGNVNTAALPPIATGGGDVF